MRRGGGRLLLGPKGTEEALAAAEPGRYSVLHLATHGYLLNDNPEASYLLLSGDGGGTGPGIVAPWAAQEGILFTSTREPKFCMCNRHIMGNLFVMDADGANIQQIGHSTLFEGHGALMPDGRILYDRWEYVDRNFGDAQGLWVTNPDGTNHAVYWGNNTNSPGAG